MTKRHRASHVESCRRQAASAMVPRATTRRAAQARRHVVGEHQVDVQRGPEVTHHVRHDGGEGGREAVPSPRRVLGPKVSLARPRF